MFRRVLDEWHGHLQPLAVLLVHTEKIHAIDPIVVIEHVVDQMLNLKAEVHGVIARSYVTLRHRAEQLLNP
jgi:hypothetical protein